MKPYEVTVEGVPTVTHNAMGQRKLVRRKRLGLRGPAEAEEPPCYQASGAPELIGGLETNVRVHDDLRQG